MIKPILVFGYGNLSRGDDALGPLLLDYIQKHCDLRKIELLTDFQLQIEHALDLEHRSLILFVDASVACITGSLIPNNSQIRFSDIIADFAYKDRHYDLGKFSRNLGVLNS